MAYRSSLATGEDELYMLAPWTGVENAGGAVQSNHCRLTLAWAVHEGLDCHLVLEERVKGSYNPEASGNNFLYQLLGVKSITVVPGGSPMMEEMEKVAEKHPDILGHFDLIKKINGEGKFFDEASPRYQQAALHALEIFFYVW